MSVSDGSGRSKVHKALIGAVIGLFVAQIGLLAVVVDMNRTMNRSMNGVLSPVAGWVIEWKEKELEYLEARADAMESAVKTAAQRGMPL